MGEEQNKDKNEHTKVSIRLGDFEVVLEGTQKNVESLMGKRLYDFIMELQEIGMAYQEPVAEEERKESKIATEAPPTEFPPPLGKPATLTDALIKLMVETGWGSKPKGLGEIMTALETNALYYKKAAVATTLVNLVKRGTLRRLGNRGDFSYVRA